MKIKCPACSKILAIPATAAGKVVACPCGKQLRAPAAKAAPAQAKPAPARPAQPKPAQPAPKAQAPRPAAPAPQPSVPPAVMAPAQEGVPNVASVSGQYVPPEQRPQTADGLFDDLTVKDLEPVKSVGRPGVKSGKPSNAIPAGYDGGEDDGKKKKKKKKKRASASSDGDDDSSMQVLSGIGGSVLMLIGVGVIVWFLFFAEARDDGDGVRFRRRSPISVGIALIFTGGGVVGRALGIFSSDDD